MRFSFRFVDTETSSMAHPLLHDGRLCASVLSVTYTDFLKWYMMVSYIYPRLVFEVTTFEEKSIPLRSPRKTACLNFTWH